MSTFGDWIERAWWQVIVCMMGFLLYSHSIMAIYLRFGRREGGSGGNMSHAYNFAHINLQGGYTVSVTYQAWGDLAGLSVAVGLEEVEMYLEMEDCSRQPPRSLRFWLGFQLSVQHPSISY